MFFKDVLELGTDFVEVEKKDFQRLFVRFRVGLEEEEISLCLVGYSTGGSRS